MITEAKESRTTAYFDIWSRAMTGVLTRQWNLFDMQFQAGLQMMGMVFGIPGSKIDDADRQQELLRLASERVAQGLAPPREIYDVGVRDLIDWSRFPNWVSPSDPELFEGSCHEG